jgi:cell volume regulation protein A
VRLNERVAATLEIESGMNDPMAVYLTLTLIGVVLASTATPGQVATDAAMWLAVLKSLLQQFGWGALAGLTAGAGLAWLLTHLGTRLAHGAGGLKDRGGVLALLIVSSGLCVFAVTTWLGGSGFLAVYSMGVIAGNRARNAVGAALPALDGYAWLSQAIMFLLLGLLVTPSEILRTLWPALGVAAVLMLVARPLSVWLCLAPFRFERREVLYISWVGLRGAVPIVLAVFPLMAGVEGARTLFNVAYVVVLASLLLQGSTIAVAARRLGVNLPDDTDEPRLRAVFGDFALAGSATVADVCQFYGLTAPPGADGPLSSWMTDALQRPPVVGDRVRLGPVDLSVRAMEGPHVSLVGLKLAQPLD